MEYSGDLRGRDFSDQNLAGARFENANLFQADFRKSCLAGATFKKCFAAEARFENAKGQDLFAESCNFFGSRFCQADLRDATFRKCVLAGTDFSGAILDRLTLTLDCNSFENAKLDQTQGAMLAFLICRADIPQRRKLLDAFNGRERAWLEKMFAR